MGGKAFGGRKLTTFERASDDAHATYLTSLSGLEVGGIPSEGDGFNNAGEKLFTYIHR